MNLIRNLQLSSKYRLASLLALFLLLGLPVYAFLAEEKPGPKEPANQASPKAAVIRTTSADQLKVAQMAEASGVRTEWHPRLGTPFSIRGSGLGQRRSYSGGKGLTLQGGGHYEQDAIAVMDNLTPFYRLQDAEKEFAVTQVEQDSLGFHHVRLAQLHQGLKVFGGQVLVHFDSSGEAYQVNGQYIPDIQVEVVPKIDAAQAASVAQGDLAAIGKAAATLQASPILVVFAREGEPSLAFELTLRYSDSKAAPGRWRYWIDANSGKVLLRYNDIQTACPTPNGAHATLTGTILAGEGGSTASFTGWRENTGYYYLNNTNRHWLIANVATSGYLDNNTCAYRSTADWGTSDRAEVSGARNFDLVQRYYSEVMGRNSFDNAGALARANIHEGSSYVNAYWDGSAFYFGDGDGTVANSLVVLDVCGHEYTHAVTEHTSDLIYSDESGALNESFSDVMGASIEFWAQPDGRAQYPSKSPGIADWLCGEDCWLSSVALRDLRNPRNTATVGAGNEQPSRYHGTYWYSGTGDNGGVHINSGVQNFFFYLLTEGGSGNNDGLLYTVTGVGITNAQQIACRALTVYCTPNTDYQLARSAWISAAMDLNTNWVASVGAAWSAVGIGALSVSLESVAFRGPVGGPFKPLTKTYTLLNRGASPMNWGAGQSQSWLVLSPTNGTIPANGSSLVLAAVSATAATLPMGIYTNTIVFSNNLETTLVTRQVRLLVGQPDYFAELFGANDNDLDFQTLTFTPDGSTSYYSVCREVASSFPTDPAGGTTVTLGDDTFATATLTGTNTVAIYNRRASSFYIGSNGYLTLNSGDTSFSESFANHFNRPRISGCFDDLNPGSGGTVSWKQASDRVAVTFSNAREYGTTATVSFQIELFYDGRLRITYLGVGITDGLAGLSAGLGVAAGFAESDLTGYSECLPPDNLIIDPAAGLISQGYEGGPFTPVSATYTLSNAGTNALNWSATVTQPWVTITSAGGRLVPNATTNVLVLISPNALLLTNGSYTAAVTFSNLTTGFVQSRGVSLRVIPIPGELLVLDSIPPTANLDMPFGNVNVGQSRTEHITLTNTDTTYGLRFSSISLAGGSYIEDFNDGQAQGWLPDNAANWQVLNGEYRAQTGGDDFMTSRYDGQQWSDVTAQVSCRRNGSPNNSAAVAVRATADFDDSTGSGYVFQIATADSYAVWKQVNGSWSFLQPWTTSTTINTGTNTLAAVAQGNVLRFYINGTLVWTGTDTELANGRIGLMGYSDSSEATTHYFDNVIVSEPQSGGIVGAQQQWYNQHAELTDQRAKAPKVALPAYPGQPDPPLSQGLCLTELSRTNGPWRLENLPDLPFTLPARGSLTLDVIYTPAAERSNDAKVVIDCNDADEPQTEVYLTGQGIPDLLLVSPAIDFVSQGAPGGPFNPTSSIYVLSNSSPAAISWAARHSQNWVAVTPTNGTVAIGQSANVTVALTALANSLPAGQYSDLVTFSNFTSGAVQRRGVMMTAQIPPPPLAEALDQPDWTFLTGGAMPWVGETTNTHDSVDAAQSGAISYSQESWMETTLQGPGAVTFWWAVSSESGYDFLEFRTNGVVATRISGTRGWTWVSNRVASGTTVLRWRYTKDGSVNAGYDRGWVDQVDFVPDSPITASGTALLAETCGSGNGAIDPNETVTVSFGLRNAGSLGATNVVATLLPTGGVTAPSGPQNYGTLLPGGPAVSNAFTFSAIGACGGTLAATLQVQYGTNVEQVLYTFNLGQSALYLTENFDVVTAPTLPAGWSASLTGTGTAWATTTVRSDTLPNAVFAPDPSATSTNTLTSPTFFLPATGGQFSFRHAYSTESCCDGGRLEISIAGAAFTDILAAGGSFVTNGYTAGSGWFGTSANFPGFITTIVNLPASALGQNIALRWRFISDSSVSGTGWYVDTVSVSGGFACCGPPMIVTQPANQAVRPGTNVTFCVSASGSLPMSYQWRKDGTNLVNGGRIAGATSMCLTLSGVVESDSGQYSVVLNNLNGSAVSSNATLLVSALDHFSWSSVPSPQLMGTPFPVTITARNESGSVVSNFAGTVALSGSMGGGLTTNTILGNLVHTHSYSDNYTLGYGFTPNTNLTVTHMRSYSGTKMSIWTDAGVLLVSQNVSGSAGVWTETPLATPLALTAGTTYRVAFYTGGGSYYYRDGRPTTFPNGTLVDGYYYSTGDAFPTEFYSGDANIFLCDLRYTVGTSVSIAITPTTSGSFTGGSWTGDITVLQPAASMNLVAADSTGHSGTSANFNVLFANDLSVAIVSSPDSVPVGGYLTNTITVASSGPTAATGVTATNFLPASASFVSAAASQGSWILAGSQVECALGTLSGGAAATINVITTSGVAGQITNRFAVGRFEADSYPGNNSAASVTTVVMPALSIADASVQEGNNGQTNMVFPVRLSPAPAQTVIVSFSTIDGTAQAGSDYVATNGTLTFLSGQSNALIAVAVLGDTNAEPNETFFVNLASPTNAVLARAQATGTILSDDLGAFFDDFEPGIDLLQWAGFGGTVGSTVLAANYGGSVSPTYSLWFGDAGSRYAVSRLLNTTQGGVVDFWLRIAAGTGSTWEMADLPDEGIVLEYSINSGGSWVEFGRYDTDNYWVWTHVVVDIPAAAQTGNTQLRWRQLSNSGTGYDHWALDDVGVFVGPRPPMIVTQPANQAVRPGTNVTFCVSASGSLPMSYQWRKDGTNLVNGGRITGATSTCMTLSGVVETDSGRYSVVLSNLNGSAVSSDATLLVSALDHFAWNSIASPQIDQVAFPVSIMAVDALNHRVASFNGCVALSSVVVQTNIAGTGTADVNFPMGTFYHDERVQVIYQPAEVGGTGRIMALSLDVSTLPGQIMNLWTVRMKHTPMLIYTNTLWESSSSWTVVYQTNLNVTATGWITFVLTTPFDYNGVDCLMVDFSFNNSSYSNDGSCRATSRSGTRSLYYRTDSGYGDPLTWSGGSPSPNASSFTPNLRLVMGGGSPVPILPVTACFTNGLWSDLMTVLTPANYLMLRADNGLGTAGLSGPFNVLPLAPMILGQPTNQTVLGGGTATFCVTAIGTDPMTYHWSRNGTPLPGASGPCYVTNGVQSSDSGSRFSCLISNAYGMVQSADALLTVPLPPPSSFAAPGRITVPSSGASAPYPSTNLVAGVVGTVVKASVTLSNINHTYPEDLDILLVGPGGQTVMLMSDAGGSTALVNVTLTFDSDAANSLPDSAVITAGTWRPTDYEVGDLLPAPAPVGPYGTNLAVFNGQDPNGAWRLFVADDTAGDSGSIANGWMLQLAVTAPVGNWLLPPRVEAGSIQLRFATAAGQSYVIQYKNALNDKAWQTLQTVVGDGSIITVQDAISSSTQRFYRLQVP